MRLPGFTAEDSLYKPSGHYHMTGTVDQVEGVGHGIILVAVSFQPWLNQFLVQPFCYRRQPDCYYDCMKRCTDDPFYCDHNCRCCCSESPHRCRYI
jgi:hypothetical protein